MYSVKIKNNIQNFFSILDNTVPGSSPYAVNKTISNSDNSFCTNVSQSVAPPVINLLQGSSPERFTIGVTVPSGTYRYLWFYRPSSSSNTISIQVGNISFSSSSVIFSLPASPFTTGYVSYNHPDSSVYSGFLRLINGFSTAEIVNLAVTVYDINTITTANELTCTQSGIVYVSYSKYGSGITGNAICTDLEISPGETLSSAVVDIINVFDNTNYTGQFQNLTEITSVPSGTTGNQNSKFIVVYSTAIFSIN